jgi:hypothetical protein
MFKLALVAAAFLLFPVTGKTDAVFVWRDAQGVKIPDSNARATATAAGGGASAGGGTSSSTPPSSATTPPIHPSVVSFPSGNWKQAFFCTFANSPTDCGFSVQQKARGRATIVNIGRDGSTGLRLRTEPFDYNVAGSGAMERTDLWLSQSATGCYEGREQVWEHSILFPDDFAMPTWHMYVVFAFHNSNPGPGQANFHVNFENGQLIFRGYGGATMAGGEFKALIGPITKNVWYDFIYHVKWSSGADGFFKGWVNGEQKLNHRGPTLYAGQGCYLKLANYHTPVCDPYPGCVGPASSVIHDRVIRHDLQ